MKRVVITGIGLVTPLGLDVATTWSNLTNGKSGIKKIPVSLFDTSDLTAQIAAYIPTKEEDEKLGFLAEDWIDLKNIRTMDRFIQLGLVAANQAIADSGFIAQTEEEQNRTGVIVSSGIGGLICIENHANILQEKGPRRVSPYFIPASLINLLSGHISIKHNFKGPNFSVVSACASGAHSIGESARIIRDGDADVMIAGGAEAAICRLGVAGFAAARALSTKYNDAPEKASRPWDKGRDGFVMGEGAGVVVLEEYENAKKRGANIYAEIIGYGLTGDAYHITSPETTGDGGARAMQQAIAKSGLNPDAIDYINAHGTSTPPGDMVELGAVKRLFSNAKNNLCMSSTKSAIGHLLGAAGSVEAIFTVLAMKHGIIPPTLNLESPEEECEGINLVPKQAIEKNTKVALSNSFGFGGTNASLLFKKI